MSISSKELNEFVVNLIYQQGLNKHQLDSFDLFIQQGLPQIMETLFEVSQEVILENKHMDEVDKIHFNVKLKNIRVFRPAINNMQIYPNLCRRNDHTYLLKVLFDVHVVLKLFLVSGETQTKTHEILDRDFKLPNMLKSKSCHLYGLSHDELLLKKEDPTDPGGIFIARGKEWLIRSTESKLFNWPHIYNTHHEREMTRLELLSKQGDAFEHSSQIVLVLNTSKQITIKFTSYAPYKPLAIPFFVFYRLFGMINDKQIIDMILSSAPSELIRQQIQEILISAMLSADGCFAGIENMLDPHKILNKVATCIVDPSGKEKVFDSKKSFMIATHENNFLIMMNDLLLPHIGKSFGDQQNKLIYLSMLIYQLLAVHLEIIPETDRDSWMNKRANTSGIQLSKLFKTLVNLTIFQPIKNKLTEELGKTSYKSLQVPTILNMIFKNAKLENTFITALTTGTSEVKVTRSVTAANRISSEALIRKNMLFSISAQRTIIVQSIGVNKQYDRALKIRAIHYSQIGYICPSQSADSGEPVGLIKQLAIGTLISSAQDSTAFRHYILNDPQVTSLNSINILDVNTAQQAKIFINGALVGITDKPEEFVLRCREARRGFEYDFATKKFKQTFAPTINAYVSIYWDFILNYVHFWLDPGRLLKPLFIVRNNTNIDPVGQQFYFKDLDKFQQKLVLTRADFKLSVQELVSHGIIEYIYPNELDNMLIAYDIYKLRENEHNHYLQYTHCDVPILNLGLPSLTSPFASCNQTPRITFQTNQSKQTIGIASLVPDVRCDKHTFYSYRCELPVTYTMANLLVPPNGQTEYVINYSFGYNQEDSLVMNHTATARFLHKTIEYNYLKIILEQNEKFGIYTNNLKNQYKHLNYNKLAPGLYYPKKYTIIEANDVVVAKYMENKITNTITNTSYIHTGFEAIVVDDIITGKTVDNYEFCKIRYYTLRHLAVGDKFSSRHGQKGVISIMPHHSYLPFTADGMQPDKLLNPLALPARMTNGQLKEGLCSKLCVLTGEFMDATVFEDPNIQDVSDRLESFGKDRWGREAYYDGWTGHWIDSLISSTEIFYQRLPKNAATEMFTASSDSSRKSLITKQPLDGKANAGGLRFGEMEKDVSLASGSVSFAAQKLRDDSDGTYIYVCGHCNWIMNVNEKEEKYICNNCFGKKNPICHKIYTGWVSLSMVRHNACSAIGMDLIPQKLPLEYT